MEAIGGSATGTVSALNEATWCDIFPNVPPDVYKDKVVDIFIRLGKDPGPLFVVLWRPSQKQRTNKEMQSWEMLKKHAIPKDFGGKEMF